MDPTFFAMMRFPLKDKTSFCILKTILKMVNLELPFIFVLFYKGKTK